MKLLIVESPSKAKTIEKYLKGVFTVRASVGHIRDLPKSNKDAINIEGGFIPYYEISKGKEKIVSDLKQMSQKAVEIILATDPDREGEAISWHLQQILNKDKKITAPIKRVTFNEITKEAIEEALKNPRDIDQNLVKAQEARRVLDRLVGYDLSGLIWKKVRYGLSAGRVQSPALRIIMEREREIRAFTPEEYFTIEGSFKTKDNKNLNLSCSIEPRDINIVNEILKLGKSEKWHIVDVKESEQKRSPRAPFTTSTLQQTASSRLGFSPSRTMQIAQRLYESGLITYMRTDSTNLSITSQNQILSLIEKKYGTEYAELRFYKTKSKNAQEAHEAIRPTHIEQDQTGINEEQKKLYRLIWERTVSSQMVDAKLLKTKITANISPLLNKEGVGSGNSKKSPPRPLGTPPQQEGEKFPDFTATGSRIISLGWLMCDTLSRGEDIELPKVENNEEIKLIDLISNQKFTEPPNRYSEAGLIKELEARGIGRPSTYASIMKTLDDRGYVKKEGKTLFPTDTGDVVSSFLEDNFANYISDTFTAEMEDKLDDISNGKRDYTKTLKDFYKPFKKEITQKENLAKATNMGEAPKDILCPMCKKNMIIKLSKNGKFYSCSDYPDCAGARTIEGKELEGPKETGEKCPLCGDKTGKNGNGKLVTREGRFGIFISCSRYPKCKFIKQDEEELKKKMTDITCPICNKGKMMERRGRFGIFYSCSNYPDCKNAIKAKPTGNICHLCQSLMMEGTKTIPERCSNKMCRNHNPHKHGENIVNNKKKSI